MKINFIRVGIAILFACDVYMASEAAYYASVQTAELMFVTFFMGIIAGVLISIEVASPEGENE